MLVDVNSMLAVAVPAFHNLILNLCCVSRSDKKLSGTLALTLTFFTVSNSRSVSNMLLLIISSPAWMKHFGKNYFAS